MRLSFQRKLLVLLATVVSGALHAYATDGVFPDYDSYLAFLYGDLILLAPGLILGLLTAPFLFYGNRQFIGKTIAWVVVTGVSFFIAFVITMFFEAFLADAGVPGAHILAFAIGGFSGALILSIGFAVFQDLEVKIGKIKWKVTLSAGTVLGALFGNTYSTTSEAAEFLFFSISTYAYDISQWLFVVWPTVIIALLLFWPNQKEQIPQIPK